MPRPARGPRVIELRRAGRPVTYQIRDGATRFVIRGARSRSEADLALADYIKGVGVLNAASPGDYLVTDALALYATEHAPHVAAPERIAYAIRALVPFWSGLSAQDVTGAVCRRYVAQRGVSPSTARRELAVLQAALNYAHREGYLTQPAKVTLPPKGRPRDRYLTRTEAYWLLRGARRLRRDGRHLADFIVLSLYTGTRQAAACNIAVSTAPTLHHGRIDPVTGLIYRAGQAERETVKRRGVARCPRRLLAMARAKHRAGRRWFVEDCDGNRVANPRKGFAHAKGIAEELARAAGQPIDLGGVTMHTLKHTAITWAVQGGATLAECASFFGTSAATIERTYWHHSPDAHAGVLAAMERR